MVDIVLPRAVGSTGPAGQSATVAVGTVTTLPPGSPATVVNVGTSSAAVLDFSIPRGNDGAGAGDVVGPASATADALVQFDGTTGKLIKVGPSLGVGASTSIPTRADADARYSSISDVLNTQTGTTYTLQASDNGKVVEFSNAAAITLTIPVLTAGFNCLIRQIAAGVPSWTASGTTLRNRQSHTKLAGQWAEASISYRTTTEVVISGDTAT